MGMKFTPEQQRVIELHNSNILVSAAAGSGKTAVLVERIKMCIRDRCSSSFSCHQGQAALRWLG